MLRHVYTYLVLFATLMMTIGGSVSAFIGLSDYIVPDPYIESYESYKDDYINRHYFRDNYGNQIAYPEDYYQEEIKPKIDEDKIQANYDQMKEEEIRQERQRALKHIIQSLGWVIIPFPIFLYFQRQQRQSRKNS